MPLPIDARTWRKRGNIWVVGAFVAAATAGIVAAGPWFLAGRANDKLAACVEEQRIASQGSRKTADQIREELWASAVQLGLAPFLRKGDIHVERISSTAAVWIEYERPVRVLWFTTQRTFTIDVRSNCQI